MASSQQAKLIEEPQTEEGPDSLFDYDTRQRSPDALLSLLAHLKRQDDEATNN